MKTEVQLSQVEPVRWSGDPHGGSLDLLDQRLLPDDEHRVVCRNVRETADAIRTMVVRGAPAIGLTAAYGMVFALREAAASGGRAALQELRDTLRLARPTAVNLAWALQRVDAAIHGLEPGADAISAAWETARLIRRDDIAANVAMGELGAALLPPRARVLTICNTGSLATAGYGTALGVIRSAHRRGELERVIACETRPYLQGARLTMWELQRDEIPATLVTDGMVAHLMREGHVDAVIAGADRIAANGDTANKIGTYGLAVLAMYHKIPFYIAAPWSTVDLDTPDGGHIPIEERDAAEVTSFRDRPIAPAGANAMHPAFDVTPSHLIDAIITERGVFRRAYDLRAV